MSKCYNFHISRLPGPRQHCIMRGNDTRFLGMNFSVNNSYSINLSRTMRNLWCIVIVCSMFSPSMDLVTFNKHGKRIHYTMKYFLNSVIFFIFIFFAFAFYHKIHLSIEMVVPHWGVYLPKCYCYRKCMSHRIITWHYQARTVWALYLVLKKPN